MSDSSYAIDEHMNPGPAPYVVLYDFAGARGSYGTHDTYADARAKAREVHRHYHGFAAVYVLNHAQYARVRAAMLAEVSWGTYGNLLESLNVHPASVHPVLPSTSPAPLLPSFVPSPTGAVWADPLTSPPVLGSEPSTPPPAKDSSPATPPTQTDTSPPTFPQGVRARVVKAVGVALLAVAGNVAKHLIQRGSWSIHDTCFNVDLQEAEATLVSLYDDLVAELERLKGYAASTGGPGHRDHDSRLRAWLRDYGDDKGPEWRADLVAVLDELDRLRAASSHPLVMVGFNELGQCLRCGNKSVVCSACSTRWCGGECVPNPGVCPACGRRAGT